MRKAAWLSPLESQLSQAPEEDAALAGERDRPAQENAALAGENAALKGRLGKNSSNSDKPPSFEPPHAPKPKPKSRRVKQAKSRAPKGGAKAMA